MTCVLLLCLYVSLDKKGFTINTSSTCIKTLLNKNHTCARCFKIIFYDVECVSYQCISYIILCKFYRYGILWFSFSCICDWPELRACAGDNPVLKDDIQDQCLHAGPRKVWKIQFLNLKFISFYNSEIISPMGYSLVHFDLHIFYEPNVVDYCFGFLLVRVAKSL